MITDQQLFDLLHDWVVTAEHDGGYVLGRSVTLLDLETTAR